MLETLKLLYRFPAWLTGVCIGAIGAVIVITGVGVLQIALFIGVEKQYRDNDGCCGLFAHFREKKKPEEQEKPKESE